MATVRRGMLPTDHFTIISNAWLRDEALPWAARGLLGWMASHTEGYDITEEAIVAAGPSGRDAVRTMIQALEEAGYLQRIRTPILTGGSTVDYVLTDPGAAENPTLGSSGKSDPRADQEEQGVSAGEPNGGKSAARSYSEDQKKTKTPSVSKQATRVPDDFQPTDDLRAWFVAEQLGAVIDGKLEHEKFMDYWRAASGANARKHDWPATWRNWMRRAAQNATPRPWRPGNAAVPISGAPYRPGQSTTDDRVMQGLALVQQFRLEEENKA